MIEPGRWPGYGILSLVGMDVFLAVVVALFAIALIRVRRKDRENDRLRGSFADRPVLFRDRVEVHYRLPYGWSTKRLGFMQVTVRPGLVDVEPRVPISGSEWLFQSSDLRIDHALIGLRRSPDSWLVLESIQRPEQAVAVRSKARQTELEQAVRASLRPDHSTG
jgi:hypothetical protein